MIHAVGVDIGGSHISGVVIDRKFKILKKCEMSLPKKINRKLFISRLHRVLDNLCGAERPKAIGIGVAAIVRGTTVKQSTHLSLIKGMDFGKVLMRYGAKVVADNEVNCLACGEMSGRKEKNMVVITLGTGIGGGIIINRKLYRGRNYDGEVGHMTLERNGPRCVCGNRGCFEEFCSARAVTRLSGRILGKVMEPRKVYELAEGGDKRALRLWNEYGRSLGTGLANVVFILDPDVIVLGGGIANAMKFFRKSMLAEMRSRLSIPPPRIVKAKDYGNAFGAACMAAKGQNQPT
jgi:glucokinase